MTVCRLEQATEMYTCTCAWDIFIPMFVFVCGYIYYMYMYAHNFNRNNRYTGLWRNCMCQCVYSTGEGVAWGPEDQAHCTVLPCRHEWHMTPL